MVARLAWRGIDRAQHQPCAIRIAAAAASAQGLDAGGALLMLGAGLVLATVLAPLVAAAAIRISLN